VLRDVMLLARKCDTWLTLHELARLTQYGEASISAQLRHLRKSKYGGFALEKRQREGAVLRGTENGTVREYQLRGKIRRTFQRASVRGWGEQLAAMPAVC
jgi:hypothetical protein